MGTITISLPEQMQRFVDEQALAKGFASSAAYLCELVRREHLCHAQWLLAELTRERLGPGPAVAVARPVWDDKPVRVAAKQRRA